MGWLDLLPWTAAVGMVMVVVGLAGLWWRRPASRLDRVLAEAIPGEGGGEKGRPGFRGLIHPLLSGVGGLSSRLHPTAGYLALERALLLAGRPNGWTAREYIGLRTMATAGGSAAGFVMAARSASLDVALLAALMWGAAGFVAPGMWLRRRIEARQRRIARDLPDALDLMSLCLDAGLGLEGAMAVAARRWRGPLIEDLAQVLSEVRLGWPRHEALRRLLQRTEVGELSALVAALIQADQLGSSLRSTLKLQAIDARSAYLRGVREAGHRAPIRMIIPMTLFVLPAMFMVIIGPIVPEMARSLMGG